MILVIPELRLLDCRCLLFINGEKNTEKLYRDLSDNPMQFCCLLRRENAKSIHLTLDDENLKEEHLNQILQLVKSVDIPIQVSARFDNSSQCQYLLDNGVFRIFICLTNSFNSNEIISLINKYTPSRVAAKADVIGTKLIFDKPIDISLSDFFNQLKDIGFQRVLLKDNLIVESNNNYKLEFLKVLCIETKMKLTLYDGINQAKDLWNLNEYLKFGIDSVVLGDALFKNYFPCQRIWRMAEADLEIRKEDK